MASLQEICVNELLSGKFLKTVDDAAKIIARLREIGPNDARLGPLYKAAFIFLRDRLPVLLDSFGRENIIELVGADAFNLMERTMAERIAAEQKLAVYRGVPLDAEQVELTEDEVHNGHYPLRALIQGVLWPADIDPTKREIYLSPAEFEQVFSMTKVEFEALPSFKRIRMKKEKLLF